MGDPFRKSSVWIIHSFRIRRRVVLTSAVGHQPNTATLHQDADLQTVAFRFQRGPDIPMQLKQEIGIFFGRRPLRMETQAQGDFVQSDRPRPAADFPDRYFHVVRKHLRDIDEIHGLAHDVFRTLRFSVLRFYHMIKFRGVL